MSEYSEREIADVVVRIVTEMPGITTTELIEEARTRMEPTGRDLDILKDRNDDKFSQKVRNIVSHGSLVDKINTTGGRNRKWYPK